MFRQLAVETMVAQRLRATYDNKFHARTGHRHIHTPQVTQEAYGAACIIAYQTDNDYVALLSLKAVDGTNRDMPAQLPEIMLHLQQATYQPRLASVGSDNTKVHPLTFNPLG